MSAYDDAQRLYKQASEKWGWFRRTLAKHPLTVFWITLGVSAVVIGWPLGRLHWPF